MSRKHFVAMAEQIRKIENPAERKRAAESMAQVCAESNRNFNRSRFMSACGVE